MSYEKKLTDIKGIGKGTAKKIMKYAPTEEILADKLNSPESYDDMLDKFRDNIVEKLKDKFPKKQEIQTEEIKIKEVAKDDIPEKKTEVYKQDNTIFIDEKGLSRFVRINEKKVQYDCPNCQTHIQVVIGKECPICNYKFKNKK